MSGDLNVTPIPVQLPVGVLARLLAWDVEWALVPEPMTSGGAVAHAADLIANWAEDEVAGKLSDALVERLERRLLETVVFGYSVGLVDGAPPLGMLPDRQNADDFAAALQERHPGRVALVIAYAKDGSVLYEDRLEPKDEEETS